MSSNAITPIAIDDDSTRPLRELYFELGRSLFTHGRSADAILSFQHALEEQDGELDEGKILFYLARTLETDGKKREAFHTYLEAILRNPTRCGPILIYAQALLTHSVAVAEKGWLQEEWTKKITAMELSQEDRAQTAFFLGQFSLSLETYRAALDYFRQAMESLADDARVVEGYGEALWKTREAAKAEQELQKARAMVARSGNRQRLLEIDVKLAQVFADCDHYDKALPLIAKLLTNDTRYAFDLFLSRAQCYLALGDANRSLTAVDSAISQNTASAKAHLLRAQTLIALGRYQDAITSTNQALQNDPSNRQVLFYKSQALIEGQIDLDQGRSLLTRYIERSGQTAFHAEAQSPAFSARLTDGNAHYFLAEGYRLVKDVDKALEEVLLALEYKPYGTISYPEAPLYRLKAELLEVYGKRLEAAAAYEDAGNNYGWRNDAQTAVALLEKARDLKEDNAQIYWDLSNAYYMSCLLEDYPYVKADAFEKSSKAWEKGIQISLPGVENSWIYLLKGFINDRRLLLTNDVNERLGQVWESIAYVERALLLQEQEAYRWAYLARYHRTLNNEANALTATQRALTYEKDNVAILDEHGAILANIGRFEEALDAIEKRLHLEANTWAEGVKAYILMHMEGKKNEALDTIEKVMQNPSVDIWTRALRALCYRLLDRQSDALEDYKILWAKYKDSDPNNLFDFAWAAFYLGKVDNAIAMMQQALSDPLQEESSAHVSLSRFYFEKGDLASAEKHLALFIERVTNLRHFKSFVDIDYPEMQRAYAETPAGPQIMALLNTTREQLEARREQLTHEKAPLDEVQQCLAQYKNGGGNDARIIVGMHATLARLRREQKDWSGATTEYRILQGYLKLFPEVNRGLEDIFEALQNEGDALLKPPAPAQQTPDPAGALARYHELLGLEIFTEDRIQQSDLHARLGLASLAAGDAATARQHFLKAFQLVHERTLPEAGGHLGLVCSTLLTDANHYWALEDEWHALADLPAPNEMLRLDINAARSVLQQYLYQEYQLSSDTVSSPVIDRIVLEVGEGLLPADANNNMPLVKEYIPTIRQHVYEQWGVILPSVRVRDNAQLGNNEYLILLDEIPVLHATIPLSMGFCLVPIEHLQHLGIPLDDLKEVANPLDASPCCWVAERSWPLVSEHQIELWQDPFFFISTHMHAFLSGRSEEFVRLQDVDTLIERWRQNDLGTALIRAALPDDDARRDLSQILCALLKERVPITAWEDILTVFRDYKHDFQSTLRMMRLQLQRFLPGNAFNQNLVELQPDLEEKIGQWVSYQQQTLVFTATSQEIWELLSAIYNQVKSYECVLVVSSPDLRWLVRQLIEMVFPALMVLAREEVLPGTT